tara:strand:- start:49 stop:324 length:276 start_codon:yes stop_codon:yes gene_type:complete
MTLEAGLNMPALVPLINSILGAVRVPAGKPIGVAKEPPVALNTASVDGPFWKVISPVFQEVPFLIIALAGKYKALDVVIAPLEIVPAKVAD